MKSAAIARALAAAIDIYDERFHSLPVINIARYGNAIWR